MFYTYVMPSPVLAPYVRHYWVLELDHSDDIGRERVIPSDSIQLMFHYKNPFLTLKSGSASLQPRSFISGIDTTYSDASICGDSGVIAVVFHPLGACRFFDFPLQEVASRNVGLADIGYNCMLDLEDRICNAESNLERIAAIEEFLVGRLKTESDPNIQLMRKSLELIDFSKGQVRVGDLAKDLFITNKTLERRFKSLVGIAPKHYIRLKRFLHTVRSLQAVGTSHLVDIAYNSGFYDQAHFINDFKTFSGYTPKEYVSLCSTRSYSEI